MMVRNHFLNSLSEENRKLLSDRGSPFTLPANHVLYSEGEQPSRVFFLHTGLASIVIDTPEGTQVEVGLIGQYGGVGLSFALGGLASGSRCILQAEALGLAVPLPVVRHLLEENREFRAKTLNFIQAYLSASQRVSACLRVHSATERLVRWLLTCHLLGTTTQFPFTHELLAMMAGVQRTTVSSIINQLQSEGLLQHGSGTVTLLDLKGLEGRACGCFASVRSTYESLYGT